jgi:hypothetical protein
MYSDSRVENDTTHLEKAATARNATMAIRATVPPNRWTHIAMTVRLHSHRLILNHNGSSDGI